MILQQEGCYSSFRNIWLTKWVPSILAIADAEGIQCHENNMEEVDDLSEGYTATLSNCAYSNFFNRVCNTSSCKGFGQNVSACT